MYILYFSDHNKALLSNNIKYQRYLTKAIVKCYKKKNTKQNEINACLRCGGDKCVCDREKQQTTKITTKSLINSP